MTSEYEGEVEVEVEVVAAAAVARYRVKVRITNDLTGNVWEVGDTLQVEDIPSSVLKVYVDRGYLEEVNG